MDSLARSLQKRNPKKLGYTGVFLRTFARYPHLLLKVFFLFR